MKKETIMERRTFLHLSTIAAVTLLSGCGGGSSNMGSASGKGERNNGNDTDSFNALSAPLPIPALLRPVERNGIKQYDLTLKNAQHTFFSGISTDTYAINGTYLSPTLLLQRGDTVSVNYTNLLGETVTMHGHGMHVPPDMDGTAHQPILPGKSWSARYTVDQPACTNWYHPHTMGRTAEHVYKGLAGLMIIEDENSRSLGLPSRYGIDDIPLVLQDREFRNGQISYDPSMRQVMHGYVGETFIVNGAIEPVFDAEAKELRLRILNGSNSTIYELGFSDGRTFRQIASDNAFLDSPVPLSRLTLSPAERAEIIVDLSHDFGGSITLEEYRHNKRFMTINVTKQPLADTTLPDRLTRLEHHSADEVARTRRFTLSGMMGSFRINGKSMDLDRIDEVVPLGEVERWEIVNDMMVDHNFHIHATYFTIIERNGDPDAVPPNERGYKDVVFVPARERVTFLVKMTDHSNPDIPYMYHCHFLEHEDAGMMGQFTVV